jgi:hypothetical protein
MARAPRSTAEVIAINEPTDGGNETIEFSEPYIVEFTITGVSDVLFHRWNSEAVEEKAAASKNSKGKKSDNVESYVYRDAQNNICLPGEYIRQAMINAAKFRQDPRSPRKSAMDLYKAGIATETLLASLGTKKWDYLDKRRVTVQRAGINRVRPALSKGWTATFQFIILLPEYISKDDFHAVLTNAGKLIGIGDFRPTFGRFNVVNFRIIS